MMFQIYMYLIRDSVRSLRVQLFYNRCAWTPTTAGTMNLYLQVWCSLCVDLSIITNLCRRHCSSPCAVTNNNNSSSNNNSKWGIYSLMEEYSTRESPVWVHSRQISRKTTDGHQIVSTCKPKVYPDDYQLLLITYNFIIFYSSLH